MSITEPTGKQTNYVDQLNADFSKNPSSDKKILAVATEGVNKKQ